jgi:hypothetical protein
VLISGPSSVGVEFTPIPQVNLGVSLTGLGSGEVTSYPFGISCPGTCSEHFDEGATIRLIPSADPKSAFIGWSGAGCEGAGTGVCVVQMSHAQSVEAEFEREVAGAGAAQAAKSRSAGLSPKLLRVGGPAALLTLRAPSSGSISAAGRDMTASAVKADGAETVLLRLRLNRAGRHALAHHGRVRTRVKFLFTQRGGGAGVTGAKMLTFRRGGERR